jgi:hypothetical protein
VEIIPSIKNWIKEDLDSDIMHAEEEHEKLTAIFEHCETESQQILLLRGHIFFNSDPNFYEALHLYSAGFFEPHYLGFNIKLYPNYELELKGDEFNISDPNYRETYHNDLLVRIVRWNMNTGEWERVSTRSVQVKDEVDPNNKSEIKNFGLKVLSISKEELRDTEKLGEIYHTLCDELLEDIREYTEIRELKFY